ncbi:hypothetical protein [Streptomonospora litoralis]|uniref:Nucleic acid-binding protein n=1 Tax=Streptomonospora litoralis TaxID=2498135 RepID=A0A4P6PWF3_9ACTN|nr:hypothetical protein [Streptomonospora litoralis]QBI52498.1 hypothetical protein EKD16_03435 [Streptomonospora litoralis]
MNAATHCYVLDTGPLSHFARSQWLGVLKLVLKGSRVVIPDVVRDELIRGGAQHPYMHAVFEQSWIEVVALDTDELLHAFARYERRLVGANGKNVGECGVLALAGSLPHATAVVDDRVAGNAAKAANIRVRRTLGLLCEGIYRGELTVALVSAVADDLIADAYRLPFEPGGFAKWAEAQGLAGPSADSGEPDPGR